jgi:glycosyltransferase involved in cell wall biosynthesis
VKVAFDTRPLSNPHGVGRYSRCLLSALHDTAGLGDELLETPRPSSFARSRGVDVYHAPWMSGALLHSPCPMVVTVHGLTALKRRSEHLRGGLRLHLRNLAVQRAAGVIVPTRAVAEDVIGELGVDGDRVTVVPEAADAAMYPRGAEQIASARARFGLPQSYLVWVGGLEHPDPGRHVAELAAAARRLPLVMVGSTRPWAHELPDVILTGRVSDEHLAAIYSGAHALVLPSDGEGFGLPAVEALACGTPVAAFDSPTLREALGGRATFVPSGDMTALIECAQSAQRPAPAPAAWSWSDAAQASWHAYSRAIADAQEVRVSSARQRATRARRIDGLEPQ